MKRVTVLCLLLVVVFSGNVNAAKFKIGISDIEFKAEMNESDKDRHSYGRRKPAESTQAFIDMLTTAIAKTSKFDLVERKRMAEILKEQAMGDSGVIDEESAQTMGKIKGVDYIILGAITEYGLEAKSTGFGNFAVGKATANIAVDVRIVSAKTGSIVIADTVRESKKAASSIKAEGFSQDEANGKILSDVMRQSANSIANLIVETIYPIKVVAITKSGIIMLNYGKGFLEKGQHLEVFSQGEGFVDPDTGEMLGNEEELVGEIVISDTQAKFSKATLVTKTADFEKGMICRKSAASVAKTKEKDEKKKGLFGVF
ncbi:MAG: hypothetical protein KAJ07_09030 [Planctomycetes bacterium]|nr:hypothetical protein [Planctomycetota bacterium]